MHHCPLPALFTHGPDVLRTARQLVVLVHKSTSLFPRGHASLRDQLRRSAQSVYLNVAEAAGRRTLGDKRRAYDIARGECLEAMAAIDLAGLLGLMHPSDVARGFDLTDRTSAMLYRLSRRRE